MNLTAKEERVLSTLRVLSPCNMTALAGVCSAASRTVLESLESKGLVTVGRYEIALV